MILITIIKFLYLVKNLDLHHDQEYPKLNTLLNILFSILNLRKLKKN